MAQILLRIQIHVTFSLVAYMKPTLSGIPLKTSAIARTLLATIVLSSATAASAFAASYTYSDTLSASSPSYVRPLRSFGDYRYSAFGFNASQTGAYQITTEAPTYDGYLFLYSGSFDPLDPLKNLIQSSDDGTSTMNSSLIAQLAAGINYFVINTTYSTFASNAEFYPNAAGFTTTINGPGTITAINEVPEPETYTLLLAGLGLMGFAAILRKPTNQRP